MAQKTAILERSRPANGAQFCADSRSLREDPWLSFASGPPGASGATYDNMLIHGDNLPSLQALESYFKGKIKCAYLDPPYNTGSTFEHYHDNLEHSAWLAMIKQRLVLLRHLLRDDGFLCAHIDDSEGPYLKVLLDEVFGRANFLATLYIRVRYAGKALKQDMDFHREVECVHIYRKSPGAKPQKNTVASSLAKFRYSIETTGEPAQILTLGGKRVDVFRKGTYTVRQGEGSPGGLKEVWASGTILDGNSSGRFFRDYLSGREHLDGLGALYRVEGIGDDKHPHRFFSGPKRLGATKGKYYQGVPKGQDSGTRRETPILGFYDLAGAFGNCRHEGGVDFRCGKKPEALLEVLLRHFSSPGDWVLDPFAGSGTTGAVAHKMGRRWIMLEQGPQCLSHILPRLRSVVAAQDRTGITALVGWQGGGGFRVFGLAPS